VPAFGKEVRENLHTERKDRDTRLNEPSMQSSMMNMRGPARHGRPRSGPAGHVEEPGVGRPTARATVTGFDGRAAIGRQSPAFARPGSGPRACDDSWSRAIISLNSGWSRSGARSGFVLNDATSS
jgi:hypothetical protein